MAPSAVEPTLHKIRHFISIVIQSQLRLLWGRLQGGLKILKYCLSKGQDCAFNSHGIHPKYMPIYKFM